MTNAYWCSGCSFQRAARTRLLVPSNFSSSTANFFKFSNKLFPSTKKAITFVGQLAPQEENYTTCCRSRLSLKRPDPSLRNSDAQEPRDLFSIGS
ncbi:unnamed protein product [Amoebophrya sp. A25]|nr:unnamed protein product [Amoebophrya sp. A25]|eukprot:GSA25T00019947001.1